MDVRLCKCLVALQFLLESGCDSLWDSPAAVLESFGGSFCCKVPFHSKAWKWFGNFGQRVGRISWEAFPPHLRTAGFSPAPPVRASVLRRRHEGSFWLGRGGVLICSRLFGPSGSGSTWPCVAACCAPAAASLTSLFLKGGISPGEIAKAEEPAQARVCLAFLTGDLLGGVTY